MKETIRDFRPHKVGLRKVLGDLEAEIMEVVWEQDRVLVRDVHRQLAEGRDIAYTTVMTVMGRLVEKGILERQPVGNAYSYTPVVSRSEFMERVAREVVDGLLSEFAEPAVSHFVERMATEEDEENLSQLEDLIRKSRQKG